MNIDSAIFISHDWKSLFKSMNIKYSCYVQNYEFFNIIHDFFSPLAFCYVLCSFLFASFTPFTIIIENIFSSAIFSFFFRLRLLFFCFTQCAHATMSIRSAMNQQKEQQQKERKRVKESRIHRQEKSCWKAAINRKENFGHKKYTLR